MYISHVLVAALGATSTAHAFDLAEETHTAVQHSKRFFGDLLGWISNPFSAKSELTCPPVWNEISTTLTAQFLADGECTDAARAAIRSAFHDCFNGACDGSLILAGECSNSENRGMERLCENLGNLAQEKDVGTADLIQFAAAHAIKTCPGGPTVPVKVGRPDSDVANPTGILPSGHANGGDMVRLFGKHPPFTPPQPYTALTTSPLTASKGFTAIDLAALIGAHTTARQRFTDPSQANATLDSTPGKWDNKFYQETKSDSAPFTLPVDKSIATNPVTTVPFSSFAASKSAWDVAFVSAMQKLSMLGVKDDGLIDCTSALPGGSRKREIKRSNVFDRLKW